MVPELAVAVVDEVPAVGEAAGVELPQPDTINMAAAPVVNAIPAKVKREVIVRASYDVGCTRAQPETGQLVISQGSL